MKKIQSIIQNGCVINAIAIVLYAAVVLFSKHAKANTAIAILQNQKTAIASP